MENQRLDELIEKYILKTATIQEQQELLDWYNTENGEEITWLSEQLNEEVLVKKRLLLNINKRIQPKSKSIKLWPRIAAAAAILLVAGAGLFFYTSYYAPRHLDDRRDLLNYANDIAPGKNTATITLANGKTIQLSDAKTGVIIDATSLKYNDGSAVEPSSRGTEGSLGHANSRDLSHAVEMTKLATPRGGTYQITLPDGTKVWLNAASSLSFPSTFTGLGTRKVELSGEAYFEVAKDKAYPFIVQTDKQEVEVLGTHFNINSYADEASTKTTLLEGSVAVRHLDDRRDPLNSTDKRSNSVELAKGSVLPAGRDDVILKPNQQSVLTANNQIKVTTVDPEMAIAWKEGFFKFKEDKLEDILHRVSRWYDVEIIYVNESLKNKAYSGTVSRFANVSQVLKKLELTGSVHFKIEGRTIEVSK